MPKKLGESANFLGRTGFLGETTRNPQKVSDLKVQKQNHPNRIVANI
jgi:hypothetical protein